MQSIHRCSCLIFELLRTISNVFFIVFRCRHLALSAWHTVLLPLLQLQPNKYQYYRVLFSLNIMSSIKQLNGVEFIKQMSKENPCIQIVVPIRFRFLFRFLMLSSNNLGLHVQPNENPTEMNYFHCRSDCAMPNAK